MTQKQKTEALRLMRLFKLEKKVQDEFEASDTLFVGRAVPGGHYGENLPATPAEEAIAARFAAKTGGAPYYMVCRRTEMGVIYLMPFVSPNEWAWHTTEAPELWNGAYYRVQVYCYNAGYCMDNTQPMEDGRGDVTMGILQARFGSLL